MMSGTWKSSCELLRPSNYSGRHEVGGARELSPRFQQSANFDFLWEQYSLEVTKKWPKELGNAMETVRRHCLGNGDFTHAQKFHSHATKSLHLGQINIFKVSI